MKAAILVAGAVLTAGAAIALPATAFAATTSAAHPSACAKTHGTYQGKRVGSYWIRGGNSTGIHVQHAGLLQVWHSAKCQTVWAVTTKAKAYTKKPLFTVAESDYKVKGGKYLFKTKTATVRGSVTSPVQSIGKHRTVNFDGGWVGDLQYNREVTIKF